MLLPSSKVFKTPFRVHATFKDVIVIRTSIDAGNDSIKMIDSLVNLEKPQSLKNVKYAGEVAGVKDNYQNLHDAFFRDEFIIKEGF